MSDDKKKDDAKVKVGEGLWAVRGGDQSVTYTIIGAPTPASKRWLSVAQSVGGPILSYPEAEFHNLYHRVDAPDAE